MDYFLICTALNPPHMSALVDAISEAAEGLGQRLRRREGKGESGWVILDFGGLVAHIFLGEMREFYDLDSRWGDAQVSRLRPNLQPGSIQGLNLATRHGLRVRLQ